MNVVVILLNQSGTTYQLVCDPLLKGERREEETYSKCASRLIQEAVGVITDTANPLYIIYYTDTSQPSMVYGCVLQLPVLSSKPEVNVKVLEILNPNELANQVLEKSDTNNIMQWILVYIYLASCLKCTYAEKTLLNLFRWSKRIKQVDCC